MLIVTRIELCQHGVRTSGEMALHDFRNFVELRHSGLVEGATFELDADVGASAKTQELGIHLISATHDDATLHHTHHALVDGSS